MQQSFMRHAGNDKNPLRVLNTGGWLDIDAKRDHLPAPILIYKDGSVREPTLMDGV